MARFIRNLYLPISANATSSLNRVWFFKEALLAAGWTENSNDGDLAWASALNVLVSVGAGATGFAVDSTKPREVYSPSGVFLPGHVGMIITLMATNDQNGGLWRISEYIDANNVKIDSVGWFSQGWTTESGIAARITTGLGLAMAAGAWVLLDSPVGYNLQVRILHSDTSNIYLYARPRGKLGDATEIASVTLGAYYMQWQRLNFYGDGANFMFFTTQYSSNSGLASCSAVAIGHLVDVDAADTDPVFVLSRNNSAHTAFLYSFDIKMLNSALASIAAYATTLKIGNDSSIIIDNVDFHSIFGGRLINGNPGYVPVRAPWVVLDNTIGVGACVRGKLPMIRSTYQGLQTWTPVDAAGNWVVMGPGTAIPRNGPHDPMFLWAIAP